MRFQDGKTISGIYMTSFDANQTGYLYRYRYRNSNAGGKIENAYGDVQELVDVVFQAADDKGEQARGRVAHIISQNGRQANHIVVESASWNESRDLVFKARRPLDGPDSKKLLIRLSKIKSITFAPVTFDGENITPGKKVSFWRTGDLAPVIPSLADQEESYLEESEYKSTDNFADEITGISAVYGDQSPFKDESDRKTGTFELGGDATQESLLAMGGLIFIGLVGGLMVITFVLGTFVLLFAARGEGINDLTIPRAVMTSALLAFIPPGLLLVSIATTIFFPLPFLQIILWIGGMFAFWLSSKIIVAGMLEVNEGKAFDILIQFYALIILGACGIWIYFLMK